MDDSDFSSTLLLFFFFVLGLAAIVLYFIPAIVAFKRNHPHRVAILIVDLVFGLTAIGWIGSLVWALITPREADFSIPIRVSRESERREPGFVTPDKVCPSCAETVKAAAAKCRFCGHVFVAAMLAIAVLAVTPARAEYVCANLMQTLNDGDMATATAYILRVWQRFNDQRVALGCEPIRADSITNPGNYEAVVINVRTLCTYFGMGSLLDTSIANAYQMAVRQQASVSQLGFGDQRPAQCR